MISTVTAVEFANFDCPDEVRSFEKGKIELLKLEGGIIGRITLEPGWHWAEHVKPIVGTEWCEAPHFQYHLQGTLHILMYDGAEFDAKPGMVTHLPSGHDAWVVGDEPVIAIDWAGAMNYAKEE